MDRKLVEIFREQLLRNKQLLLDVSKDSQTATETVELDQTRQGRLSRMDALQGQAMSIAASHRRKAQLKNIELALKRIDNGDYGLCQHCDREISLPRLEFNPTVSYCIQCAEKIEAENQNPG